MHIKRQKEKCARRMWFSLFFSTQKKRATGAAHSNICIIYTLNIFRDIFWVRFQYSAQRSPRREFTFFARHNFSPSQWRSVQIRKENYNIFFSSAALINGNVSLKIPQESSFRTSSFLCLGVAWCSYLFFAVVVSLESDS